jgi:hypothetical protein
MIRRYGSLHGYSTALRIVGRSIIELRPPGTRPTRWAILTLAVLLAACAQPAPTPTPTSAPTLTHAPAPTVARRPTTVEVDPTAPPVPSPTPAPRGDCPASFAGLDVLDRAMFGNMTLIQDIFIDRRFVIWDNQYRLNDMPMLLARRDRAGVMPGYGFLINQQDDANLLNAQTFEIPTYFDLGTVYCISPLPRTYGLETRSYLPQLPLGANHDGPARPEEIDDFAVALIYGDRSKESLTTDRLADPRAVEQWTSYAVRVGFYRWQIVEGFINQQFLPANFTDAVLETPPAKEEVALALLEQRILAAVLRDGAVDERLLRQFVAIRQSRLARYPNMVKDEAGREQRDGTAEYVVYRFMTASGFTQLQSWPERLMAPYAGDSPPEPGIDPAALVRYLRAERPALSGAVLGLVLDAVALPWRPHLGEGQTPFDVLEAAFRIKNDEREALAQQAKERFNYAELEARAEMLLGSAR